MSIEIKVADMKKAHQVLARLDYKISALEKGYTNHALRINLDKNTIEILPVTEQMKDLWVGGKGFDLWFMLQEIKPTTRWDSHENPI